MDLWNLTGLQTRILREAILSAFKSRESLNSFLRKLDKPALDDVASVSSYDEQASQLIHAAKAQGWLPALIAGLQTSRPDNVLLRNLPDALRLGDASATAVSPNAKTLLEKMTSNSSFADLGSWATRMSEIGEATCRIEVQLDHQKVYGTGFLVADDLVLTNYHLVEDYINGERDPARIGCRFDYAMDVQGLGQGLFVPLVSGPTWLAASSPYDPADISGDGVAAPDHLDFALMRLSRPVGKQDMGNGLRRGHITLANPSSPAPVADDPVFIVQHPRDNPLTMSVGTVVGLGDGGARLRYNADTLGGSSGSAVFDDQLQLIALHQVGDPTAKTRAASYNQGIPIDKIAAMVAGKIGLSDFPPEVHMPSRSAPPLVDYGSPGSPIGSADSSTKGRTWTTESALRTTKPVSGEGIEAAGAAPKRSLNAWIDNPAPTVGKPFRISINIGAATGAEIAQAAFGEPDWRGIDSIDLMVTVSSIHCTADPGWRQLKLGRTGDSDIIHFSVTTDVAGRHEFTVRVYLAKQMIRLQSLSFTVAVTAEQLHRAGAAP